MQAINHLATRHKKLRFAKSAIHNVGLFAMERITANDMVIEYVGEVVRQYIAEKREQLYEQQGIYNCYMYMFGE